LLLKIIKIYYIEKMNSLNSMYAMKKTIQQIIIGDSSGNLPVKGASLRLWLDASDPNATGTPPASATSIQTWRDKSQYGNNCIAKINTASTFMSWKPTDFNNKPCFVFGGRSLSCRFVGQFINSSNITSNAMYCFVVSANNSTTTGTGGASEFAARFIGFSITDGGKDYDFDGCWGFLRQSDTGLAPYRHGVYLTGNNPATYNFPTVWQAGYTGTQAKASFLNGNSTTTQSASNTAGNFNINYFTIGSNSDYTDAPSFLTGRISEILVYSGTLTSDQIARIESYLAFKWGLDSLLPTSHPYKQSPP
jgi:hypothetical protein